MSHALFHLLATCARVRCAPIHYRQISDAAERVTTWDALPMYAQAHGLASLANAHLRSANVALPRTIQRELSALDAQGRAVSRIQLKVLGDLVRQFQAHNIPVLTLKGAALANLLYPEPGLRPMRDLDLLVHRADLKRAQTLLGALGFVAPLTFAGHQEHRHLSAATQVFEGVPVHIELHHTLFEPGASPILMDWEHLTSPRVSFSLDADGLLGWTLGYEDMLWHLCQHLIESTNIFSAVALIWVADIVGFAERFCEQINWVNVQRHYPIVLHTLSLLHFLTPLFADLVQRAQLDLGVEPPGLWDEFQKLPRTTPEAQMNQTQWQTMRRAATPSAWWLRLHYGLGSAQPLCWHHRLAHLAYLARRFWHVRRRQSRLNELPRTLE